jgi:hypothetical protein
VSARKPHFLWLALFLLVYTVTYCVSLRYVAQYYEYLQIIAFNDAHLGAAIINVAIFAILSLLFTFSRFSFGYFVGFYFYSMILGYAWIVSFSVFHYDPLRATISAFVSILAFLVPTLLITSPLPQKFVLSDRAFDGLLNGILIVAAVTIATGAFYNFKIMAMADIYNFRNAIEFPGLLKYAIGMTSGALLPFTFACFVARRSRWQAAASLFLLLMLYPITLTKLALFAPFWLLFLTFLSRRCDTRTAVWLSLFLPLLAGLVTIPLTKIGFLVYPPINSLFGTVNFRMIASPSITLDIYNDFFTQHGVTYFCQISILKSLVSCPYNAPLSIVMEKAYHVGALNGSLFATEGIASVGLLWAPLAALVCGLVISIANRASSSLPSRFILISGSLLVQVLMNVPLTTTLLTNGGALLFLLWYLTPRAMFDAPQAIAVNEPKGAF